MNGFLALLIPVGFGIFSLVCEARPAPVHYYIFTITGVVTAEDAHQRKTRR